MMAVHNCNKEALDCIIANESYFKEYEDVVFQIYDKMDGYE